ncbi:MAG: ABC transporter ATP-binding protein [Coprothermobacterota bacterium]|nr:ABC transporter ATP-binding protein [Coprothermobacterota bacterium]
MSMTSDWAIETVGLSKTFGSRLAVEDLTLQVPRGEVLAFLGPNGAGKTTTTRILAGMIAPSGGRATVSGLEVDRQPELLHERIGLLTETPGFYEWMSARDNLLFFARFYPIPAQENVDRLLHSMDLWDRRNDRVGSFSKGMKQRLALARAMLHAPEVLFLDEPTAGLDPEAARDVRALIGQLQEEGRTIFLCSHNLEEAEELADRIALFRTRLVALDSPAALRVRLFRRTLLVELENPCLMLLEAAQRVSGVQDVSLDGNRLTVHLLDFERDRPLLVSALVEEGAAIRSVFEEQHSLEEIYLSLLADEPNKLAPVVDKERRKR